MVSTTALSAQLEESGDRKSSLRRAFLAGGCAAAVSCTFPRDAQASTIVLPDATGNRQFTVLYKGSRIGAHTVSYSSITGETQVSTDIRLLVKVGFFTVFAFRHRSSETWRAGRLMALSSVTVEHGETLHIAGAATPQGFRVVSKGGPFIASAATLTSNSLWTPAVLEQATVVDAHHGGVIGVSARKRGDEQILVAGRQVRARRYTLITPYLAGSIWYDEQGLWVHSEFERDGSKIQYRLDA